jgi:integrase/recombinase XerD
MKPWPDSDFVLIESYLQQGVLRDTTKGPYRSVIRGFQAFVSDTFPGQPFSQEVLRGWLYDRGKEWSFETLIQETRQINRFLDWLVTVGSLSVNPLAQLRQVYGRNNMPNIVRALLSSDPIGALESLRPMPRFASHLGPLMLDHLKRMRALGYRYESEEQKLLQFDRYLRNRPDAAAQSFETLIIEWADLTANSMLRFQRLYVGRSLANSLRRTDPTIKIISVDPRQMREAKRQQRHPYIFSEDEIRQLLETARCQTSLRAPLRPLTLQTMLTLAYGAGLRLGEFVRLTVGDFNPDEGTVEIRNTKFFKSRCLPLSGTVTTALRKYIAARERAGASLLPDSAFFWNEQNRRGYSLVTIERSLADIIRKAGLKPKTGRVGPRIHDLRHSFVVHRMLAWYRAGINPQTRLQHLVAYLGHKDIHSTLVYLTITQELLQQAGDRFHAIGERVIRHNIGGTACE